MVGTYGATRSNAPPSLAVRYNGGLGLSSLDDDLFMWAGQYAAGFAQRASYPTIDAGLAAVSKPEKPRLKGMRNKLNSIPFPDPIRAPESNHVKLPGIGTVDNK